jgi:hypothetical protein
MSTSGLVGGFLGDLKLLNQTLIGNKIFLSKEIQAYRMTIV